MNKKIIILVVTLVAIITAGVITAIVVSNKKANRESAENTEKLNNKYVYILEIKGDFSYDGKKVIKNQVTIDDWEIMDKVAIYNEYKGTSITMSDVTTAYDKFCNGEDGYEILNELYDFYYQFKLNAWDDIYFSMICTARRDLYPDKKITELNNDEYNECCKSGAKLMRTYLEEEGKEIK